MEYALLLFTILCAALRSIFTKLSTSEKALYAKAKINVVIFSIGFLTVLLLGILSIETIFQVPWFLAVIYALCMVMAQVFMMLAFELGPVSISSLIYYCAFIVPTVFGSIYYREKISFLHIIGLLLIISSFVLSLKLEDKKGGWRWFIASVLSCVFSGIIGCCQIILVLEHPNIKIDNFMQISFFFMVVFGLLIVLFTYLFEKKKFAITNNNAVSSVDAKTKWKNVICIVLLGAILGLTNKINVFLAGALPSIVAFPAINGGGILATSILSIIIFKEKTNVRQKFALLAGLMGVLAVAFGNLLI